MVVSTVPHLVVSTQPTGAIAGERVGNPLNANCIVSTVDGVEFSDVNINWAGPGVSTNRFVMGNITSLENNMYSRALRVEYLLKDDGNTPFFCIATILEASDTESFELESLSGEYVNIINCSTRCTLVPGWQAPENSFFQDVCMCACVCLYVSVCPPQKLS